MTLSELLGNFKQKMSQFLEDERPLTTTQQIKEENPRVMENWKASLQTGGI